MKILLNALDLTLIIALAIALVVAIVIFLCVGTFHVKKDHAIIIERLGAFEAMRTEGWCFYMPFKYQRVGYYCIAPQERKITLLNGNELFVSYQIEDVKKFHYSKKTIEHLVQEIGLENKEITKELLQEKFSEVGARFISVRGK